MKNNKLWPEIDSLLKEAMGATPPDEDKVVEVLKLIAQDPIAQEYYYKLLVPEIYSEEDFSGGMKQFCPDFQILFHRSMIQITPPLDFIRELNLAIVTVELFIKRKYEEKKEIKFIEIPAPAIITSDGVILDCNINELIKLNLTAKTLPAQALPRWHPEDVAKFITSKKYGVTIAPRLPSLFELIRGVFKSYVYFETPVTYDFMSIFVVSTYFYPLFQAYPLLILFGPTESAKTLVMQLMENLAFNGMMLTDPTPAIVFRTIEEFGPTLIMDEIEGLANKSNYASSIMSILRAKYKRINVFRMEEKKDGGFILRAFQCFSPTVIGTIKGVENVLANRSIIITMKRCSEEEAKQYKSSNPAMETERWRNLRDQLYRLIMTSWEELDALIIPTVKELEGTLSNRQLELWTPFLSIANWIDHEREDKGRPLFGALLDMALQKSRDRKNIDREMDHTLVMLQALQQLKPKLNKSCEEPDYWYSTQEIRDQLEQFYSEPQGWMNEVWIGRIMQQIGITESRRKKVIPAEGDNNLQGEKKLTHYKIDPKWLKDYCERYGVGLDE